MLEGIERLFLMIECAVMVLMVMIPMGVWSTMQVYGMFGLAMGIPFAVAFLDGYREGFED